MTQMALDQQCPKNTTCKRCLEWALSNLVNFFCKNPKSVMCHLDDFLFHNPDFTLVLLVSVPIENLTSCYSIPTLPRYEGIS